ncbi:hypothetical protein GGF37_004548 [Kickxella alabastrina]|nr:hypothetical protein GGF37_004548 [Kickxella alabastrina]
MLPLKYQFVVPGGRFREIYNWDTYFTLEGILRSGLKEVAKSNIRCLLDFVDIYGFVPNGARSYYLDRSQPPLLTLMVKLYYEHTNDSEFVRQSMPLLIKEHQYWQENHAVVVNTPGGNVTLNRYIVDTDQPRPESYSVDYELAHNVSSDPLRQAVIYAEMAAGAESGWDYSSRWVRNTAAPADTFLNEIRTSLVVPVELNAILYQVEETLAEFASLFKVPEDASKFKKLAETRHRDMQTVFYDADTGLYYDYFLEESKRSTVFSPASVWPYWAFGKNSAGNSQRAFTYVSQTLKHNPGGIPVTLINSGQQWDWPMAWPPLQYVTIQGALATNNTALANALAQSYVNSVFCAWYSTGGSIPNVLNQLPGQTDSGHMFEKFNSADVGKQGGGGEYVVQAGFGWTNGVLLWALDKFANVLKTPVCPRTQLNIVSK